MYTYAFRDRWGAGLHTGLHSVEWLAGPHVNLLWRAGAHTNLLWRVGAHTNPHLVCIYHAPINRPNDPKILDLSPRSISLTWPGSLTIVEEETMSARDASERRGEFLVRGVISPSATETAWQLVQQEQIETRCVVLASGGVRVAFIQVTLAYDLWSWTEYRNLMVRITWSWRKQSRANLQRQEKALSKCFQWFCWPLLGVYCCNPVTGLPSDSPDTGLELLSVCFVWRINPIHSHNTTGHEPLSQINFLIFFLISQRRLDQILLSKMTLKKSLNKKFIESTSNIKIKVKRYTLQTIPILPQEKMAIWVVENMSISLRLFYKMTQE
jgi:hypothetical protein